MDVTRNCFNDAASLTGVSTDEGAEYLSLGLMYRSPESSWGDISSIVNYVIENQRRTAIIGRRSMRVGCCLPSLANQTTSTGQRNRQPTHLTMLANQTGIVQYFDASVERYHSLRKAQAQAGCGDDEDTEGLEKMHSLVDAYGGAVTTSAN